jgi:NADH:ubiquinone oxidoreductase subunit D
LEKKLNQLEFQLGFRHLGIEKTCESIHYKKINHYLEGLNPRSSFFNSLLWVMLLEQAMKITIPQKAMAMRMIEMEICRVLDHFYVLLDQLKAVNANYLLAPLLQEIKRIIFWQDLIAGNSHHHLQLCLGGMRTEYSNEQLTATLQLVQILKIKIEQFVLELSKSPLWMGHANVGLIDGSKCLSLGITGPTLRAAGINYDLRKSRPYYFYSELDFEIPLGHCGSAYDRYLIHIEEIRQSLRIVSQILDHFPSGETRTHLEQEDLGNIPSAEHFLSVESPQGELAYYSVWTDKSEIPYRLKIRSPHLPLAIGLKQAFIGKDIDQIPFILASINPVWEELER